jgi:hypothetical protein
MTQEIQAGQVAGYGERQAAYMVVWGGKRKLLGTSPMAFGHTFLQNSDLVFRHWLQLHPVELCHADAQRGFRPSLSLAASPQTECRSGPSCSDEHGVNRN